MTAACLFSVLILCSCGQPGPQITISTPSTAPQVASESSASQPQITISTSTSIRTGPCSIEVRITGAEGERIDRTAGITLMDADGRELDVAVGAGSGQTFAGLDPGEYRLAVHAGPGEYMSQWYGGLPFNGHNASESQILEVKAGLNVAEFVLEVGRTISGTIAWSGSQLYEGYAFAYPLTIGDDMRTITLSGDDHTFVIPGLCPGAYKLKFKGNFKEVFYRGDSLEDAAIIDVTQGDVSGIEGDLGVLPTTTTQVTLTPTTGGTK